MSEVKTIGEGRTDKAFIDANVFALLFTELDQSWRVSNLLTDAVKKLTKPKYLSSHDCFATNVPDFTLDKKTAFAPINYAGIGDEHDTLNYDVELEALLSNTDLIGKLNSPEAKKTFLSFKLEQITESLKTFFSSRTLSPDEYYRTLVEAPQIDSVVTLDSLWTSPCYSTPEMWSNTDFKTTLLEKLSTFSPVVEIAEELFDHKRALLIEYAELVDSVISKVATSIIRAVCPIVVRPVTLSSSDEEKVGEQLWPLLMAFKNH
jgi:hypothetical protein